MPEGCPVCEARREQTRLRVKRYRERRNAAPINEGNVTTAPGKARRVTAPQTPLLEQRLSLRDEREGQAVERIAATLAPFASRGYQHDPEFWALIATEYPGVNRELQAKKIARWLTDNPRRKCSESFLDNWFRKSRRDQQADAGAPPNGTTNGVYHAPITRQHNRQPDAPRLLKDDLQPIERADFSQYQTEARRLPLEQRVAQYKAMGK